MSSWPPAGHDRQRELFSDDAEPCEPPETEGVEGVLDELDVELDRLVWEVRDSDADPCEALALIDAYREELAEECGAA